MVAKRIPFLLWLSIVISLLSSHLNYETESICTMNNYREEEVFYENKAAGIKLAGTLTTPNKSNPVPAVILIAGYGPNDRDYTLVEHKPFKVLAEYLSQNNIAVLRFDKRGVNQSTGTCETAISRDFADDVIAGIQFLKTRKEIVHNSIGLIGHSEGGMIASMVAAESKDVAFVVLMAAVVQTALDDLVTQNEAQMRADGATDALLAQDSIIRKEIFSIVKQQSDIEKAKIQILNCINNYWKELPEILKTESDMIPFAVSQTKAESFADGYNSAWYRYFFACKPTEMLSKITVSVLALYGDHDWIASSKPSLSVIDRALKEANNKDYTLLELPGLNHRFQTCQTGSMAEYATLTETIAPVILSTIANWVVDRTINQVK